MSIAEDAGRGSGEPEKLAALVARQLEDEIISRRWPIGDVLGSETELRERFEVSRAVLREAIRLLEHQHVVQMRPGPRGGLVVCAPNPSAATSALVVYLEYVGVGVEHLMQVRRLIEPLSARLVSEGITENGIELLRKITGRFENGESQCSDDFHVVLARMSGNAALELLTDVLTKLTARYADPSSVVRKTGETFDAEQSAHARVVEAVVAGEAAVAQALLASHLDDLASRLLDCRQDAPVRQMLTRPMDPDPKGVPPRKLAEVIARRLHDDIITEGRQVGDVIGTEPDLLTHYGVGRAVLREAVRILEHHSVARMRRGPGGGLVVQAPDPAVSIPALALYFDYRGLTADDLRRVREVLELGCVDSVVASASAMEGATRLRAALRDRTGKESCDAFHAEFAELSGNPILALFLRIVAELRCRHSLAGDRRIPSEPADGVQAHGEILDAVVVGDRALARHRMRRHLRAVTLG